MHWRYAIWPLAKGFRGNPALASIVLWHTVLLLSRFPSTLVLFGAFLK